MAVVADGHFFFVNLSIIRFCYLPCTLSILLNWSTYLLFCQWVTFVPITRFFIFPFILKNFLHNCIISDAKIWMISLEQMISDPFCIFSWSRKKLFSKKSPKSLAIINIIKVSFSHDFSWNNRKFFLVTNKSC